jgi:hypothetical protein
LPIETDFSTDDPKSDKQPHSAKTHAKPIGQKDALLSSKGSADKTPNDNENEQAAKDAKNQ